MTVEDREVQYSYHGATRIMLYIFMLVWVPLMLIFAAGFLAEAIQFVMGEDVEPAFVGGMAFAFLMLLLFVGVFSNQQPNIRISKRGVAVQVFLFWYALVPWQNVEEIRKSLVPFSRSRLIVVRGLTPFHRLIGWAYRLTLKPAFLVKQNLRGFDEAMRAISERSGVPLP